MRTFVAVELNEASRGALGAAVERMREGAPDLKWVAPESMHLTLKFIGELKDEQAGAALEALRAAAAGCGPFTMHVRGVSGFPPRGRPRVVHAPLEEPTGALAELARAVEEGLAEAVGVKREKRAFKAHVTLGRVRRGANCPPVPELADRAGNVEFGEVEVKEIVLMKSELTPRGAVYSVLERIPLGE